MADAVRFIMAGRVETVADPDPTQTVLQWLRARGRVGTKEGCAEGDCGACTVALGESDGCGGIAYRAVNACIQFLPSLDGRQLVTVEDLKAADGRLHPVQEALVDAHASQCGFCTPGFVMSLFALFHGGPQDDTTIRDGIAGNLCRCTGYRPILDAAHRALSGPRIDRFSEAAPATAAGLAALARSGGAAHAGAGRVFHAPRSLAELEALVPAHPDACLLAGGTDVGLWVTKQHRDLGRIVFLGEVPELRTIEETGTGLDIGAGVTYAALRPLLARHWPSFGALLGRLGSVQIRNAGTLGGNIANGSPIGDGMPALMALDAELVLNHGGRRRTLPIADYFLAYRKTALQPGEFLERVRIPLDPGLTFATWKVSKRHDQDISAVAAGLAVRLDPDGIVTLARLAFGGMAGVPKRAAAAEAVLCGRKWTLEAVTEARAALAQDFSPLTDMRASAGYRALVAGNLLIRFYLETTGQAAPAGEVAHG